MRLTDYISINWDANCVLLSGGKVEILEAGINKLTKISFLNAVFILTWNLLPLEI